MWGDEEKKSALMTSTTSTNPMWNALLPMGLTFGGMYYLSRNSPNAMRDALMASGLSGAGQMMYHYLWAPSTNTYTTALPSPSQPSQNIVGNPNQSIYGTNSGLANALPTNINIPTGFRSVVHPFDEDHDGDSEDSESDEKSAFAQGARSAHK